MVEACENISSTSVLYILIIIDFILQLSAILQNHSHLNGMTLFDTMFLIIIKTKEKELRWIPQKVFATNERISKAIYKPFIMAIASVIVQALLFVNLTHALETIFCDDETNSTHGHLEFSLKEHMLAFVLIANFLLKGFLIVFKGGRFIEVDKLSNWMRAGFFVFYLVPSLLSILMLAIPVEYFEKINTVVHANSHVIEALLVVIISPIAYSIMIPLLIKNLPYLLLNAPTDIDTMRIAHEIEEKFDYLHASVTHIHAIEKHSSNQKLKFETLMGVNLCIKQRKATTADNFKYETDMIVGGALKEMYEILRSHGANLSTIEPSIKFCDAECKAQIRDKLCDTNEADTNS